MSFLMQNKSGDFKMAWSRQERSRLSKAGWKLVKTQHR